VILRQIGLIILFFFELFVDVNCAEIFLFDLDPDALQGLLVLFSAAVLIVWLSSAAVPLVWLPFRNLLILPPPPPPSFFWGGKSKESWWLCSSFFSCFQGRMPLEGRIPLC
jgi:hypothetical protein